MQSYVGLIDSGVGGLTVLKDLKSRFQCNFRYVADQAFCPYGTKPYDVILRRVNELVTYLQKGGAQAVVLACNTASVFATELRKLHSLPIYDVITPTCEYVANTVKARRVAVLATNATIRSGAYQKNLERRGIQSTGFACSEFVPFVENNAVSSPICLKAVERKLSALRQQDFDAVILGCTHFPVMRKQIEPYCNNARIVCCKCDMPDTLTPNANASVEYLTTGNVFFAQKASRWYGGANFHYLDI